MASISNRVNEANKFLEQGHKFMKTGLLKWTPDHDNAAYQYSQAAMAFKGAGLHQKAIEANELAIKCYLTSQNSAFQAAKCMEQAAISCKELGDIQSVSKYYTRAIEVYRSIGQMDTAISVMDRAAKTLTEKMPAMAAEIFAQASEICAVEDRYRQAAEFCQRAATLYLKTKNYDRAIHMSKEEYNCYAQAGDLRNANRMSVGIILMYLASNNIVGAYETLKSFQMDDEVYGLANNLVTGYDKKDLVLINPVLKSPFFRNLDTEFAKIARDLAQEFQQRAAATNQAAASQVSDAGGAGAPSVDEDALL